MPRPATHLPPVQAIVKMVNAPPKLSLRGPEGAVAISGRHLQSVPAAVKMVCTDCVCSGGHCAAVGGSAALRMRRALYG